MGPQFANRALCHYAVLIAGFFTFVPGRLLNTLFFVKFRLRAGCGADCVDHPAREA